MKCLLPIFLLSAFFHAQAQHTLKIDSLNDLLQNDLNERSKAYTLDELSYEWFYQNLDSSLHYGQKAYRLFRKLNDPVGLSQSVTSVAVAFHYLNNWDSAQHYYEKALSIRKSNNHTTKIASSWNNLGVMYMDRHNYEKAISCYMQAMKIRESSHDSIGVAITKSNLGLILKKQKNYSKAISYYKEAMVGFERFGRVNNLEIALLNLGAIYNTMGNYRQGKIYNKRLMNLAGSRDSKRNLAKSYVNLGNSYRGLGKLDSGLFYAQKAMSYFEERKDTLNIANSLLSISQFHSEKKDYKSAIKYSTELEDLNKSLKNKEIGVENQQVLSKSYNAIGDYKNAYEALNRSYVHKDSLFNQSTSKVIADLTIKYETKQKETEISRLKIENQQAVIDQQQSANQRNILVLIVSIFVIGSVLLWLLLKTKSRLLSEKETLLKEIHHRVKNNLQVISSLLSLQSRFIKDEGAKEIVSEGQNRVKSMALIHQKLYQRDNLTGVEALEYIENLTSTLRSSYGIDNERVGIKYDVDNLNIDVDTIIPIGLILNELISNSFKYAFPDKRKGILSIYFREIKDQLMLIVKDDGVGAMVNDIDTSNSFGMRMIKSLSRKLEAEVNFDFNNGTEASLTISNYKLV